MAEPEVKMAPDYAKLKDEMRRRAQTEAEARLSMRLPEPLPKGATPAEGVSRTMPSLGSVTGAGGTVATQIAGPLAGAAVLPVTVGGPAAGLLSSNPAVRGATATSPMLMDLAERAGLSDEYKSLLSGLEERGIISVNPEYAKKAGVSTRYTRYQNEK